MRTHVTFRHPAHGVQLSDEGILAANGAQWFAQLLSRVPDLEIEKDICQEDWGIVVFAQRGGKKYWIGLSFWSGDGAWIAHFHRRLWQIDTKGDLARLISDAHAALANDPLAADIAWYEENELNKGQSRGNPTPY